MDDVLRLQSNAEASPLTLVVLDEMQQYIGEDNEKALAVQNIVEGCSARFESQVLFVATGQSALTATPTLQKLTDRFAVQVALSDKDVETVVREVILRKRPEHVPAQVQARRESAARSTAPRRHPARPWAPTSRISFPTTRCFPLAAGSGMALRAIDRAGKAGVLRTQLKIVHEAARGGRTDRPRRRRRLHLRAAGTGHVAERGTAQGDRRAHPRLRTEGRRPLKSRICALIFLISQVPSRTIGGETGLRATAPFLADLLVEDLADDGAKLRKRVPELLDALVNQGRLMRIDDEYRLQTEEGAEWEKDYRSRLAAIRDDASRMSQLRNERLLQAVDAGTGRVEAHPRYEQDAEKDRPALGPGRAADHRGRCSGLDPRRVVGH